MAFLQSAQLVCTDPAAAMLQYWITVGIIAASAGMTVFAGLMIKDRRASLRSDGSGEAAPA